MGVALSLKAPRGQIAGPHLTAQIHSFYHGNAMFFALLMDVALCLKAVRVHISLPHLTAQNHSFY